jgi:MFS transporter, MHS family, proline/betaine transporter
LHRSLLGRNHLILRHLALHADLRHHATAFATRRGSRCPIGLPCGCFALLVPLSGALSDRIGRKPILLAAFLPYLGLAYPLFAWVYANPSFTNLLIMQGVLCSLLGAFFGPFATVLAEQFPVAIRSTAIGIVSNVAATVFGGFAPFYVTWLIAATGSPIALAFYVTFGLAISVVSAWFIVDRAHEAQLQAVHSSMIRVGAE